MLLKLDLGSAARWRQHFGGGGSRGSVASRLTCDENDCWKCTAKHMRKMRSVQAIAYRPCRWNLNGADFLLCCRRRLAPILRRREAGTLDLRTQDVTWNNAKVFANEKPFWEKESMEQNLLCVSTLEREFWLRARRLCCDERSPELAKCSRTVGTDTTPGLVLLFKEIPRVLAYLSWDSYVNTIAIHSLIYSGHKHTKNSQK